MESIIFKMRRQVYIITFLNFTKENNNYKKFIYENKSLSSSIKKKRMMLLISLGLITSLCDRNQDIKETKGRNSLFQNLFFENITAGSIYFDTHIYSGINNFL